MPSAISAPNELQTTAVVIPAARALSNWSLNFESGQPGPTTLH